MQANLAGIMPRLFTVDLSTLPSQLAQPIGQIYGKAFTTGLSQFFFFLAALLLVTALLIALGMRTGLHATTQQHELALAEAAADGTEATWPINHLQIDRSRARSANGWSKRSACSSCRR